MLEVLAEEQSLCKQETRLVHEKHGRSGIQHLQFVHPSKYEKPVNKTVCLFWLR